MTQKPQYAYVSIRAPAQGATYHWRHYRNMVSFDPRPRAGGDGQRAPDDTDCSVSIRAPAQGATPLMNNVPV